MESTKIQASKSKQTPTRKSQSQLELDDETAGAIKRAEEQIDRGEGIDFDKFAREMRKRIAQK
jgi:hypothetical protein